MAVYLDHAATTPVHPDVREAMLPFLGSEFGNPSSIHRFGRDVRAAIDEARDAVATGLNTEAKRIVFTSGGTEADNLAVIGAVWPIGTKANTSLRQRWNTMLYWKRVII